MWSPASIPVTCSRNMTPTGGLVERDGLLPACLLFYRQGPGEPPVETVRPEADPRQASGHQLGT